MIISRYRIVIQSKQHGKLSFATVATSPNAALDIVQAVELCPRSIMTVEHLETLA